MHVSSMMRDAAGDDEDEDMGLPFAATAAVEGAGRTLADPFSLMPFTSAQGQTPTELAADSSTFPVEPPPPGLESGAFPLHSFSSQYIINCGFCNQQQQTLWQGCPFDRWPDVEQAMSDGRTYCESRS